MPTIDRCPRRPLGLLAVLMALTPVAGGAETLFTDGFESGALDTAWTTSSTADGRATVTDAFSPQTGSSHLVLDDASDDGAFSVAEATLGVRVAGFKNLTLSFAAKSLGNEPHRSASSDVTDRRYDGIAISVDGGTNWRFVGRLDNVGTEWETQSFSLDYNIGLLADGFVTDLLVRFSQYGKAPAPGDGIAVDDVQLTGEPSFEVAVQLPHPVDEGSGPHTGRIVLSRPAPENLTVTLTRSTEAWLDFPTSVDVPQGENSAEFTFSVLDDDLANLWRWVLITPDAETWDSVRGDLAIVDDEQPPLTLTLPETIGEEWTDPAEASVHLGWPATRNLQVFFHADNPDRLSFPSRFVIPAGETTVPFEVTGRGQSAIDGDAPVLLTVTAPGFEPASETVIVIDNTPRALYFSISHFTVWEGKRIVGTIRLAGSLPHPLEVSISSPDGTFELPDSVTIPAGQRSVQIDLTPVDNNALDGLQTGTVMVSAPGFAPDTETIEIRDDDPASFRISEIAGIIEADTPVPITLSALDVDGKVLGLPLGSINLDIVHADGITPAVPASITTAGNSWFGNFTLPSADLLRPQLRVSSASGTSTHSSRFDIVTSIDLQTSDLIWDAVTAKFYASIPPLADSPYANSVVSIDPDTLQVSASAPTGNTPHQLAITSDGSIIYAHLEEHGDIAVIDTATMTVTDVIDLGTGQGAPRTIYASDIATVDGHPDLVLVAKASTWPGLALFRNGIELPGPSDSFGTTPEIEPSTSPTIFFVRGSRELYRIQVDETGITLLPNPATLPGFYSGLTSDGDLIATVEGALIDGATSTHLGSFNNFTGDRKNVDAKVIPHQAAGRTYTLNTSGFANRLTIAGLSSYGHSTLFQIQNLQISDNSLAPPTAFVRWGESGFAFTSAEAVHFIRRSLLIPTGPPADVELSLTPPSEPLLAGSPLQFQIEVTNHGPGTAIAPKVNLQLSSELQIIAANSPGAQPLIERSQVNVVFGDLPASSSASLLVTTSTESPGSISFDARVVTGSVDPATSNNTASGTRSVGYTLSPWSSVAYRIAATHMTHDPTHDLLWLSVPDPGPTPQSGTLQSLDPHTGDVSTTVPLPSPPTVLAITPDGHYLYAGSDTAQEIYRIDLTSNTHDLTVPLGLDPESERLFAREIQPLPGDGTGILVARYSPGSNAYQGVAVYDGTQRRTRVEHGLPVIQDIAPSSAPDLFVGTSRTSGDDLHLLRVSPDGVRVEHTVTSLAPASYFGIDGLGGIVLTGQGHVIDTVAQVRTASLPKSGAPMIATAGREFYLTRGKTIDRFDARGHYTGAFQIPAPFTTVTFTGSFVNWGTDGFAVLHDEALHLVRWPTEDDADGNGLADFWEQQFFATTGVDPLADPDDDGLPNAIEHLLATSPRSPSPSPITIEASDSPPSEGWRFTFPRRRGLLSIDYTFEISNDLRTWIAVLPLTETVLSTGTTEEQIGVEMIEATFPALPPNSRYIRIKHPPPP